MKKRFVARKRNKYLIIKIILCIFIIYLSSLFTIKLLFKNKVSINDEKRVNEYLAVASNNLIGNISIIDIMNMNLTSPDTFLRLSFSNFKKIDYIDYKEEVKSIKVNNEIIEPIIYIYNTHQNEDYNPGNLKEYNIIPTVYMASIMLQEALKKAGIYSVVEDSNIKELLRINNWAYNKSYDISKTLIYNVKKEIPSIKYFIDIHRDSVSGSATINNKTYAKLMFVIGELNSNYKNNEVLVNNLQTYLKDNYNDAIKNIHYAKNGNYNQDIDSNIILVEVGGVENTIDEVYNSINILAEALIKEIIGQNES